MGRYRKIDSRIWNDAKFCSLSDNGQLCFLFLLTHPHMTSLGAMRATMKGLASERRWTEKAFREAFREASGKGMLEHDETAHFVGATNFLKYNPPESPNVVRAWVGALDMIPECPLKVQLLQRVKDFLEGLSEAFAKAFREAFAKAMPNPEPEPEPEQEQEQEQRGRGRKSAALSVELIPIPGNLESPQFAEAWTDWKKHRSEIRKPLTPTAAKAQLGQFSEWGRNRAIAAIKHTIAKGWQGIREPEANGQAKDDDVEVIR
jgi:hypothetical protein